MNPETGKIMNCTISDIWYELPPYGSVIFYAVKDKKISKNLYEVSSSEKNFGENFENFTKLINDQSIESIKLDTWDIKSGTMVIKNTPLFDWRTNDKLKYTSDEGLYTASFKIDSTEHNSGHGEYNFSNYFIDLGEVYYTAEVSINGQYVGKRLFAPYQLNLRKYLKYGDNKVEVKITTTRRNGFIGEALKKNPFYAQFNGKENEIVPSGLVGPVRIVEMYVSFRH